MSALFFQKSLTFCASRRGSEDDQEGSPEQRGFPLASAVKDFWLCFAPRYAPLLGGDDSKKPDPYARAPTQQLFQEDRTAYPKASGFRFTNVSTQCIPSIAEFVSSFPYIKRLSLSLESDFKSSLAPLSQMRLLTHLSLRKATPKHLSEIVDVSVKNLELCDFQGNELSSLFPQQEQQQGGRLQKTLRRVTLRDCPRPQLTDISALARFETLLELKLDHCWRITNLSSISKLNELRVLRVDRSPVLEMNSLVNAIMSLEFLLELEITCSAWSTVHVNILDQHVKKIVTLETLEKLKLTDLRASSETLSMLLDPQNLPNLRALELIGQPPSPFKSSADSGTCVNLESLVFNSTLIGKLDSTDISIISKKFPKLKSLLLRSNCEYETDFTPLGNLTCLSELTLGLDSNFTSIQSPSLESAIAKLVNLKKLDCDQFLGDVKKMLVPLRKLELLSGRCLSAFYEFLNASYEASTRDAILDMVEEEGHLPVLFLLEGSSTRKGSWYKDFIPIYIKIPELLEKRRKKREEQEQQQSKGGKQQELQAERREREEEESEADSTVKKKSKKTKFKGY